MVLLPALDGGALSCLPHWDRITRLGVLGIHESGELTAIRLLQMLAYLGAVFDLELLIAALAGGHRISFVG